MDSLILITFIIVYVGMILGRIPGLALDRPGVALLGAILLMAAGRVSTSELAVAVDLPTMALLFGLMVISAQFRLSGFYSHIVRQIGLAKVSPQVLLAILIAVVGVLSALLANDIVCLAMAPVLIESCARRKLDPKPFLLALACAANVGSAATLIGNPQNMLIGQVLHLSFGKYFAEAAIPSLLGLGVVWLVICWLTKGRWELETALKSVEVVPFNIWQTAKGLVILGALIVAFLVSPWPREIIALAGAGILLCSRRMQSREMIGQVDWQLLVLFFGLFVVNHAILTSGILTQFKASLIAHGIDPGQPHWLFSISVVLSNLVSNVPAVMLLLPSATHPMAGPILALSSTLAGNLIIVGSIANIIVVDQAARLGIRISWKDHARVGIPITLLTLALAALWLRLIGNN